MPKLYNPKFVGLSSNLGKDSGAEITNNHPGSDKSCQFLGKWTSFVAYCDSRNSGWNVIINVRVQYCLFAFVGIEQDFERVSVVTCTSLYY